MTHLMGCSLSQLAALDRPEPVVVRSSGRSNRYAADRTAALSLSRVKRPFKTDSVYVPVSVAAAVQDIRCKQLRSAWGGPHVGLASDSS